MCYKYCIVCTIKMSVECLIISNSECAVKISIEYV